MTDHWFKPKTRGYGAVPTDWRGWALIGVFSVMVTVLSLVMLWPDAEGAIGGGRYAAWLVVMVGLTVGFVWFCRKKTDGPWVWKALFKAGDD